MGFCATFARLALVSIFLALSSAVIAPDDTQRIVQIVESRYHSARTLKAVFLERYTENRNMVRIESGTAFFSRPGRMRWEYEEPEQKLFITDGRTVWFYVPADHTVTRAPIKQSDDMRTPLSLITGSSSLSRFCKQIELLPHAGATDTFTLRCQPRGSNGATHSPGTSSAQSGKAISPADTGEIREVMLDVDPKDGWISRVLIRETGGIELQYSFGRWQMDMDLPDSMFHFQAPKGVAIVEAGSNPAKEQ
jgi:outer membrane lipoprotein carrier protein